MKTLDDGNAVSSKSYYYLLDFNEQDRRIYINDNFNKNRLCDLTISEYKQLWKYATEKEFINK